MVGSVEPRPIVWENIRAAVGHSGPQPAMALPEAPPPPLAAAGQRPKLRRLRTVLAWTVRTSIQLSGRLRRWRNIASFATAAAAALIAMLALQVYQPELLPDGLRPKPRTQVVEVKTPAPPAAPSAQYVALLQRDGGSPAFILTVDAATKNFTVRKVGSRRAGGRQEL